MTFEQARMLGAAAGRDAALMGLHGTAGVSVLRLAYAVYWAGGSEALAVWIRAHIDAYDREWQRAKGAPL